MRVIIIGSGAVASELTSYITDNNRALPANEQLELIGYLENEANIDRYWKKYALKQPVLGSVDSYEIQKDDHFLVGIANLDYRQTVIASLKSRGGKFIGFSHHSSIIADTAVMDEGNIVCPFCIIGPNVKMGAHNLITSYSFISHDSVVGKNNFFSTAGLSGNTIVGDHNFFGIRSTVIPNVTIGSHNIIQAGMTVDKDIESNTTVFHRFKEKVIAIHKN